MSVNYLKHTRSGYYFRIRVPAALLNVLHSSELVVPLKTQSRRAARLRAAAYAVRFVALFAELKGKPYLNEQAIRERLDRALANEWDGIETEHILRERPLSEEDHDDLLQWISECESVTREQLGTADLERAGWAVDEIFDSLGLPVDRKSALYRRSCKQWLEGWLCLYARKRAMLLGEPCEGPNPVPARLNTEAQDALRAGPRISELIDSYLAEKKQGGRANEWTIKDKIAKTLQEFVELVGDLPANLVERKHIVQFRDRMLRLPKHRTIRQPYRRKSIAELLALELPKEERIGPSTIKQFLGRLSSFFDWCRAESRRTLVKENPVLCIELKADENERQPLSIGDVRQLFGSPEYLAIEKAYIWWLPLLGIYTGARLSELVKLKPEHLFQQDGVWLIGLPGTKGKNASRKIAVHSKLIELGFLQYADGVREAGHALLLFDVVLGKRTAGKHASERLGKLLDRCGIIGKDKVFHSTRHSANQEMAMGEDNLMLVQATMGHSKTDVGMTRRYFKGNQVPAALLKQTIEKISYDVDLSHLIDGWRRYIGVSCPSR